MAYLLIFLMNIFSIDIALMIMDDDENDGNDYFL